MEESKFQLTLVHNMQTKLKKAIEFETTFGNFIATAVIGQGGAGRVYAAKDDDGSPVAIKLLNADSVSKDKRKRFKNEIAFLRKATNQHLVPVLDHGVSLVSGAVGPFYVMPCYDGSLRDLIKQGISPNDVVDLFSQLLNGVEAAHLLGAVHRDLKPENVLFRRCGGRLLLAVADFGVASFTPENKATMVETGVSTRLANFVYAAPEQRRPGEHAGIPADVFALGLIFNEMFTGDVPHGAGFRKIRDAQPEFAYLDPIVDAMTQQNPQARLQSIEAIKHRLRLDHEQSMLRQRLSAVPGNVVVDSEVDDPLVINPVRIVDADWSDNTLRLTLSASVNANWIHALRNMGNFTSVMGAGPDQFNISGDKASVGISSGSAQSVINYFKVWLPTTTRVYRDNIIRERNDVARQEMEELRRQRQREEERLNVVSKLTF